MKNMHSIRSIASSALLGGLLSLLLVACGGGGGSADSTSTADTAGTADALGLFAKNLAYTDPTSKGWRLVKDSSSTPTRIVLNLVGPSGLQSRGVGFNLKKGKAAQFGTFDNGAFALDTGVFQLMGTNADYEPYAGTAADPVLFVSAPLASGDVLSTGIFQKDRTNLPKNLTQPLVQIAITLATGSNRDGSRDSSYAPAHKGDVIPLDVIKARMIPADIGGLPLFQLDVPTVGKAKMQDISIDVGRLIAR